MNNILFVLLIPVEKRGKTVLPLHQELTDNIVKACFEVINELGAGFLESVYQKALL